MSFSSYLSAEKENLRDKLRSASFDNITVFTTTPKLSKRLSSPLTEKKSSYRRKKLSKSSLDLFSTRNDSDNNKGNDFGKYLEVDTSPRLLRKQMSKERINTYSSNSHRRSLDVPLYRRDSANNDYYDDTSETDDIDCPPLADQQIEKLWKKIEKVKENLIKLQAIKDENVTIYLKITDNQTENGHHSKVKSNFERSNQKTNITIQSLQKKLEKYQQQVREVEDHGIQGGKRIIKVVQEHVRSRASSIQGHMVEQLESFNNFLKKDKKCLSMDNIIAVTDITDDNKSNDYNNGLVSSDDEYLTYAITNIIKSGEQITIAKDMSNGDKNEEVIAMRSRVELLEKECEIRKENVDQFKEMMNRVLQSLQDEKYKTEQLQMRLSDLYNQWNDLTELHQNEMSAMTDELDRTLERIECVEYRFTERSADLEENVENLVTRASKMEKQQQDQQQQPLDGYRDVNAKILLSKFLFFLINISLVVIFVVSYLTKIVMPFVSNRARLIASGVVIVAIYFLWRHSDHETGIFGYLERL